MKKTKKQKDLVCKKYNDRDMLIVNLIIDIIQSVEYDKKNNKISIPKSIF